MSLERYKKNIRSQFGEDGIIEETFKRISPQSKICIEFGAWDGEHLSNTWSLWNNHDWKAILIEGDKQKYEALLNKYKNYKNVTCIHCYVEPTGIHSLDEILSSNSLTESVDLLSIDIDGDDYHILAALKMKPRVICIEYNPTIPPDINFVQPKGEYIGSSALSIIQLALTKGYQPYFITDTNIFLITEEEFAKLSLTFKLEELFPKKYLSYIFAGYDGKTFVNQLPVYTNSGKKSVYQKIVDALKFKHKKISEFSEAKIYDK